jgi:hypothetical protein
MKKKAKKKAKAKPTARRLSRKHDGEIFDAVDCLIDHMRDADTALGIVFASSYLLHSAMLISHAHGASKNDIMMEKALGFVQFQRLMEQMSKDIAAVTGGK